MEFPEAIDYLYGRLPVFQNQGSIAYKSGLVGIRSFCNYLENPQNHFESVHIAGTNGKGSTSHMLASALQAGGYKVGLYTSPHLKSFTERIRVNGIEANHDFVVSFVTEHKAFIETHSPSFFEVTVAMAFDYFAREKVDIAIVEVGMGGRLDSTNVLTPILSIITNIGLDHTQYLGDTIVKIAREKAGIIKSGVPVIISELADPEVMEVFESVAGEANSEVIVAAKEWDTLSHVSGESTQAICLTKDNLPNGKLYEIDLLGKYQINNLKAVLSALEVLKHKNYHVCEEEIGKGLRSVSSVTGLKGRWQVLQQNPFVVCDTAHNAEGMKLAIEQFVAIKAKNHRLVLGFVSDKDIDGILALLPTDASYYFCQPSVSRALYVDELTSLAQQNGLNGNAHCDVNKALEHAISESSIKDAIYVGGSTFVVADLEGL